MQKYVLGMLFYLDLKAGVLGKEHLAAWNGDFGEGWQAEINGSRIGGFWTN